MNLPDEVINPVPGKNPVPASFAFVSLINDTSPEVAALFRFGGKKTWTQLNF